MDGKRAFAAAVIACASACDGAGFSEPAPEESPAVIMQSAPSAEAPAASSSEPDPASLCVSTECGTKEALVPLPEAENLIFTDDGRLFVSGEQLYEIVKDREGKFEAVVVPIDGDHSASLGGLAIANGVLYLNDETGRGLWAGRLGREMRMQLIHLYNGFPTPNGLDFGPDGALYSTSGPLPDMSSLTSLVRVKLDPLDPFKVIAEEKVFGFPEIPGANGLVLKGSTFFVVAYLKNVPIINSVAAFDVQADGSLGPLRIVLSDARALGFDDLEVIGDRVLVANNFGNEVLMYDMEGNRLASSGPIFAGPTSLTWGRPPMFTPTDLIVAERGMLGESRSGYGDVLSVIRRHVP